MKITITSFLFLCFSKVGFSQDYYNVNQPQSNQTQYNQFNNVQVGPSSYSLMYAIDAFVNVYNDSKREQNAKDEAQSKLTVLKQNYDSYENYPDTIKTGWHNVIVTDNFKFCRDAKVYVKDNFVQEFVIDNCLRLNFNSTGKIKRAKNVLTLNKFNGEQLEIVDVYFAYDLDEPRLTTPPIDPGYITFWTKKKGYVGRKIIFNQIPYEGVSQLFKTKPECDQIGTATLILKPGMYSFTAMKSGNDMDGNVEIRSNQCLIYELE